MNWGYGNVVLDLISDKWNSRNCWCSDIEENPYIDIEFKLHYINVTSFSLESHYINDNHIITNFTLQGYNKTGEFVDIYHHDGTPVPTKQVNFFNVQNYGLFNHFRITMVEKTLSNSWHFILGSVEFFGYIEDLDLFISCKNKKTLKIPTLFAILLSQ